MELWWCVSSNCAGYLTEEKLQEAIIDWSTLDDETKATEIESYK
jgi:hypothetical protein